MNQRSLTILNIGLDRDLLSRDVRTEAQTRQIFYAQNIPARLVHLVKAPSDTDRKRIDLNERLSIVPCPVRHWTLFVSAAIRRGSELLRQESFDLIQVQEPFVSGLVGAWLSRRFRLPLVVGLFSDEIDNPVWLSERPLNRLANPVGKWVLCRAAAVRSDSLAVTVRLSRYRFHNLTYIPFLITYADKLLASDPRAALVRQNLLDGMDGPLLLAVSRLEREKNIPLMLTALAKTARIYPGIVLAIAGSGSLADSLKLEAEHIVPGRVRWLGWIKNTDMPAFYQAADLVLLSSNRESAARVLYESLLSGTPVLTTDTAGAREVIEDRVTGRVVPVGDTEAYAQALIELCGDPSLLEKMGRVGREHMASRVTADAVAKQLRILYEKALGRVK